MSLGDKPAVRPGGVATPHVSQNMGFKGFGGLPGFGGGPATGALHSGGGGFYTGDPHPSAPGASGPPQTNIMAGSLVHNMLLLQDIMNQSQGAIAHFGTMQGINNTNRALEQGDYSLALRGLGLDQASLTNRRSDLDASGQFIDRRQTLADQLLGNSLAGIGLDRRGLDLDEAGIRRSSAADQRALANEYAARGAHFAPEHGLKRADIEADTSDSLARVEIGREGAGLSEQRAKLGRQGEQIGFDEARKDVESQQKNLDLEAQRLGISREQLANTLQRALNDLGLSDYMNVMDLMVAQDNLDAQSQALIQKINEDAYAMAGLI